MLEKIYLPDNIEVQEEGPHSATFVIHPYYPGYGPTVANALRRVLLSSLPGAAITHVQIEGVDHEFSTLPGVREDLVSLLLNLKKVRLSSTSEAPVTMKLNVKGEKVIKAGDFKAPADVKIVNPDLVIATLTNAKGSLQLEATVEQGRGYVPSETRQQESRPIGTIVLDAIFTPVERVNFQVENVRVGQSTDYHKLFLTIVTDGTITPRLALQQAASILKDHLERLTEDFTEKLTADRPVTSAAPTPEYSAEGATSTEPLNTLNLLQLPSRVHNALERVGITTVEQVAELTPEQIQDIPGLGEKAVNDIFAAREAYLKEQTSKKE